MKLFIFGSTGDLIKRKVLLSLQELRQNLEIYALGRKDITSNEYINSTCEKRCLVEFEEKIHYLKIDFEKENLCTSCSTLFDKDKVNFIYIAMPPKFLLKIIKELSQINKKFKLKILIEKPFGEDLESAIKLQKVIKENNLKDNVFLSDHYLFKNGIEKLNFKNFKEIKIVSVEKLGLENRIGYYDDVGALKDMIQGHFLNIIFRFISPQDLSDTRVKKLVRGQYKSYRGKLGKDSETETAIYLELENKEKEFIFFTGKKFFEKESWIEIDGEKTELKSGDEYKKIFNSFLNEECDGFPTIENSIESWKIIKKIENFNSKLIIYDDKITGYEFENKK